MRSESPNEVERGTRVHSSVSRLTMSVQCDIGNRMTLQHVEPDSNIPDTNWFSSTINTRYRHTRYRLSHVKGTYFRCTVNIRYRHTLGTPKKCACIVTVPVTRIRDTGTFARSSMAAVPVSRESQNFALRVRNFRPPCR